MIDIKQDPITVPCKLHVLAQFEIPKSWPKKRREAATRGEVYPGKPDIDNIVKIVADALNGVCFEDDAQVIEVVARKKYGDPVVLVTVEWDE
jgi:Holliday junction resolvase RusA-like endonuclease